MMKCVMLPLAFASWYKNNGRRTLVNTFGPGVPCFASLCFRPSHVILSMFGLLITNSLVLV